MTALAPPAMALGMSPEYLMPPSAITVTPYLSASFAQSLIAVSCGTPIPAITRVVQMEPGPMPTLIQLAPRFNEGAGGLGRGDVARDDAQVREGGAQLADLVDHFDVVGGAPSRWKSHPPWH